MVNNSTNTLYQQNEQSPLTEHKKDHDVTCDVGNPDPGQGQAQKCGEVK